MVRPKSYRGIHLCRLVLVWAGKTKIPAEKKLRKRGVMCTATPSPNIFKNSPLPPSCTWLFCILTCQRRRRKKRQSCPHLQLEIIGRRRLPACLTRAGKIKPNCLLKASPPSHSYSQLYSSHSLLYVQLTLSAIQLTLSTVQLTLSTIQLTLSTLQLTLSTVQLTLSTVQVMFDADAYTGTLSYLTFCQCNSM